MNNIDFILDEAWKTIIGVRSRSGEFRVGNSGKYYTWNGQIIAEEELKRKLEKVSPAVLNEIRADIEERNNRYLLAKVRLLRLAFKIAESDHELCILVRVIDKVCTPYQYIGNENRVYISNDTHIRLTDRTGWDSTNGELHLQKVITVDGGNCLFHEYPQFSEEDILRELLT